MRLYEYRWPYAILSKIYDMLWSTIWRPLGAHHTLPSWSNQREDVRPIVFSLSPSVISLFDNSTSVGGGRSSQSLCFCAILQQFIRSCSSDLCIFQTIKNEHFSQYKSGVQEFGSNAEFSWEINRKVRGFVQQPELWMRTWQSGRRRVHHQANQRW